ncbi:oxidoreductase [Xylariaceae sp. FL1651]|nr:oxidoreductase [Xylariaceae sp. FL1651]
MDTNYAALLAGHMRRPLRVDEVEDRFADENEIVVKTRAVSINNIDNVMQDKPWDVFAYPLILGTDVAGEVVEVGSLVTHIGVGDRVLGHALRLATEDDRHGAFQNYAVLMSNMACTIPPTLSYESAAVLPLGVSTASAALFQEDTLGLQPPSVNPQKQGSWVIVMGGAGSVGSNGVRLATAAGYDVIATASPKDFGVVKKLGAVLTIDYNSPQLADDLVRALSGKKVAGAFDANGKKDPIEAAVTAISKCNGNKVVASVADWIDPEWILPGVKAVTILAIGIRNNNVGKMVYEDYLPHALAAGKYTSYPEPYVFGDGLGSIQGALDFKSKGKKVVVTLT